MHQTMNLAGEQHSLPASHPRLGLTAAGFPDQHLMAATAPTKPRTKTSRMGHFDPDELTRRLHMVLADQKAHAERKRRTRPPGEVGPTTMHYHHHYQRREEAPGDNPSRRRAVPADDNTLVDVGPTEYYRVPREAAKQFTCTTTAEVIKHEPAAAGKRASRVPALSKTARLLAWHAGLSHEQIQVYGHEQEEAARSRHTFGAEMLRLVPESQRRRSSTGNGAGGKPSREENRRSVLGMGTEPPGADEALAGRHAAHEHRVDWTQSDEARARPRLLLTPFLRKADSLWGLRGRLAGKADKEQQQQQQPSLKSPKSSFLAKFVSKKQSV